MIRGTRCIEDRINSWNLEIWREKERKVGRNFWRLISMPFLKFEERNGDFGKTALFSLKIFSNREKEVIVLIYQRYQRSSLLCIFHTCLKTGKIVSFPKTDFSSFESNYFLISI